MPDDLLLREPAERASVPAVANDAASLMTVISRAASDPAMDVGRLEKLMELYERITARQAEQAYNEAMSLAQAEMRPVAADANNPQTKSKYASFYALDKALRPIYTHHGFSLSFDTEDSPVADHVRIVCRIRHRSGHTDRARIDMPNDGKGAKGGDVMTKTHAQGAAMSYGQRYLEKMIFNIAIGDDQDGNGFDDRTGGTKITEAQRDALILLADNVQADKRKFCEFFNIPSIADLPGNQFAKAKQMLEEKARRAPTEAPHA